MLMIPSKLGRCAQFIYSLSLFFLFFWCFVNISSQGLEWEPGTSVFSPRGMISEEVTALEIVETPVPMLFVAAGDRVRLWNLNRCAYSVVSQPARS